MFVYWIHSSFDDLAITWTGYHKLEIERLQHLLSRMSKEGYIISKQGECAYAFPILKNVVIFVMFLSHALFSFPK